MAKRKIQKIFAELGEYQYPLHGLIVIDEVGKKEISINISISSIELTAAIKAAKPKFAASKIRAVLVA